jgi:hypothetical protein
MDGTIWMEVTDQKMVIQRYWCALRVYLVCLLSKFPDYSHEVDDLLQDFIMKKILQPGWLEMADPKKGRFRDFLKSSLRHFVVSEVRKRETETRGGKTPVISLDELEQELAGPESVSDAFDIAWLQMLMSETLEQMEGACIASGSQSTWKIFHLRIIRPILEGVQPPAYESLVAEFGFKSPAQATNALATAKRMFARHLRAVVAQYEVGDKAVNAEVDALRLFLDQVSIGQGKRKSAGSEAVQPGNFAA